jgi:hypothetical protein
MATFDKLLMPSWADFPYPAQSLWEDQPPGCHAAPNPQPNYAVLATALRDR